MNISFEKVPFEQFLKDSMKCIPAPSDMSDAELLDAIRSCYDSIELPSRGTPGSAGYDFHYPYASLRVKPGETEVIPTGVRAKMDPGVVLMLYPRSGSGFKTGVHLANTTGVIDSDYYNSDNYGHIMVKLCGGFDTLELKEGAGFVQGIFLPYYTVTTSDEVKHSARKGGFGSTDEK